METKKRKKLHELDKDNINDNTSVKQLMDTIRDLKKQVENKETKIVNICDLKYHDKFKNIFPIIDFNLKVIQDSIRDNNYDKNQPVIIWDNYIVDGHTRIKACNNLKIKQIPAIKIENESIENVINYVYRLQFDRRNLTEIDKYSFLINYQCNGALEKKELLKMDVAKLLKVSERTGQKYINVIKKGNDKIKELILSGEITINKADKMLSQKKQNKPNKINSDLTNYINTHFHKDIKNSLIKIAEKFNKSTKTEYKTNMIKNLNDFISYMDGVK